MMKRGLILEVKEKHWILLTPDGDFVKVPRTNLRAEVGEEVFFQEERKGVYGRKWLPALSAAVAAMLGVFFVYPQMQPNEARAETYIYLDVNSSIAIGLNEEQNVVRVKPLNESAQKLIQETDWQNEYVGDVVVELIKTAKDKGYVHQKDRVVLSGFEENKSKTALKELEQTIKEEIKKENLNVDVHTLTVPAEAKNKAERVGLTPAKYAAWLVAKKEGQELPVQTVEKASITKLAEDIQPVSKLLEQPPNKSEWEEIIQTDSQDSAGPPATNADEPQQNPTGSEPATGNGASSGTPGTSEPSGSPAQSEPAAGSPDGGTSPDAQNGGTESQGAGEQPQTQGEQVSQ
jgi:hypothetical protein